MGEGAIIYPSRAAARTGNGKSDGRPNRWIRSERAPRHREERWDGAAEREWIATNRLRRRLFVMELATTANKAGGAGGEAIRNRFDHEPGGPSIWVKGPPGRPMRRINHMLGDEQRGYR